MSFTHLLKKQLRTQNLRHDAASDTWRELPDLITNKNIFYNELAGNDCPTEQTEQLIWIDSIHHDKLTLLLDGSDRPPPDPGNGASVASAGSMVRARVTTTWAPSDPIRQQHCSCACCCL